MQRTSGFQSSLIIGNNDNCNGLIKIKVRKGTKMAGLEIFDYNGEGYKRQMSYGEWTVALANYTDKWGRGNTTYIERHMLTDEVFVLLCGEASLLIGEEMTEVQMELGKIYNVKAGEWHQLICSPDVKILIVENDNTSAENSEKKFL